MARIGLIYQRAHPPTALRIDIQPSDVNSGVAVPIRLVVVNSHNNIVAKIGTVITAAITSGTGIITSSTTATTDATGTANFSLAITGSGVHQLTFTASGLTSIVSNSYTVGNQVLSMFTQPSNGVDAQVLPTQPVVSVSTGASGVSVTASIQSGVGLLGGTVTVLTNAQGRAIFTNLNINATTPPSAFVLSFAATGYTGVNSNSITILDTPVALVYTTQPTTIVDGATSTFTVELRSGSNSPVALAGISCGISVSSGTPIGSATAVTDGTGRATFTFGTDVASPPTNVTFTVTSTGLTSAVSNSISITASGGGPTFAFHSDWSTATGTSDAAVRDTGKTPPWSTTTEAGGGEETVVAATGRGFPAAMTNILRVNHSADSVIFVIANQIWTSPSIGSSRFFRLYLRHEGANVDGPYASAHPIESEGGTGGVSGLYYTMKVGNWANGTFPWAIDTGDNSVQLSAGIPADSGHSSAPGPLNKFQTYRIEWKLTRTATSVYSIDVRIYGADDTTLLFDRNNIYRWTVNQTIAQGAGDGMSLDDAHFRGLRLGKNGGWFAANSFVYWGGFAVSTTDWCGPYTVAG